MSGFAKYPKTVRFIIFAAILLTATTFYERGKDSLRPALGDMSTELSKIEQENLNLRQSLLLLGIDVNTKTSEDILMDVIQTQHAKTAMEQKPVAEFMNMCDDIDLLKTEGAIK